MCPIAVGDIAQMCDVTCSHGKTWSAVVGLLVALSHATSTSALCHLVASICTVAIGAPD